MNFDKKCEHLTSNVNIAESGLHLSSSAHPKFSLSKVTVLDRVWVLQPQKPRFNFVLVNMDFKQVSLALEPCIPPSETGGFGVGECWDGLLACLL